MKLLDKIFILGCSLFCICSTTAFAQGGDDKSCESAEELTDVFTYYTGSFADGDLIDSLNVPICITANTDYELSEVWYQFTADGISNYYFYCTGIIGAAEVYAGTCRNRTLINCVPSDQTACYTELLSPEAGTYMVRLVGYVLPGFIDYSLDYNHVDPTPSCTISIDDYSVYPCVSEDGKIAVAVSGSLENWTPGIFPFVEIETDFGYYFTADAMEGDTWTANVEVEGTMMNSIQVVYGSSANYCSDVVYNIPLPTESCTGPVASMTGSIDWSSSCAERSGDVWFYEPGTDNLQAHYFVDIDENGTFLINYPMLGTFDIILKADGYMSKGFTNILLMNDANTMACGALPAGDLDGDDAVTYLDFSIISNLYGTDAAPDFPQADLNCDGYIDLLDFSALASAYGESGVVPPLSGN